MPIAAPVEPMPDGLSGRDRHRTGAAERGEAGLGSETVRIVAGCKQQLRRSDVADRVACDEVGCEFIDDGADHGIEVGDFVVQFEIAASQRLEGDAIGSLDVAIAVRSGRQAARVRMSCMRVMLRRRSRNSSGAQTIVFWVICMATRLAATAVFRHADRTRRDSTMPSRLRG